MNQQYMFQVSYYDFLIQNNSHSNHLQQYHDRLTKDVIYEPGEEKIMFTEQSFLMETRYPGMLIGLGYPHYAGRENQKKEIKCGFTLDYVTGLPYWPGSSLKGTLRNAFETKVDNHYLVQMLLEDMEIILDDISYNNLVQEIFGSKIGKERENQKGEDIFLDAVLANPNKNNQVLGEDYITSHELSEKDRIGLKEPNPVRILRILPEVRILFRFQLKDSNVCKDLTADKKKRLYEQIIEIMGVGAKTNIGYGALKLVEINPETVWRELVPKQSRENNRSNNSAYQKEQKGRSNQKQRREGNYSGKRR